jgi:hypothetical protein
MYGVTNFFKQKLVNAMRKLMLTLAGALMISMTATVVNAQDTTQVQQQKDPTLQINQQKVPKDYSLIKTDEVPASLRTALKGDEYLGWESGWIYQNKTNNQYLVRIGTGNDTKSYYFDNSGKRVKDIPKQD